MRNGSLDGGKVIVVAGCILSMLLNLFEPTVAQSSSSSTFTIRDYSLPKQTLDGVTMSSDISISHLNETIPLYRNGVCLDVDYFSVTFVNDDDEGPGGMPIEPIGTCASRQRIIGKVQLTDGQVAATDSSLKDLNDIPGNGIWTIQIDNTEFSQNTILIAWNMEVTCNDNTDTCADDVIVDLPICKETPAPSPAPSPGPTKSSKSSKKSKKSSKSDSNVFEDHEQEPEERTQYPVCVVDENGFYQTICTELDDLDDLPERENLYFYSCGCCTYGEDSPPWFCIEDDDASAVSAIGYFLIDEVEEEEDGTNGEEEDNTRERSLIRTNHLHRASSQHRTGGKKNKGA